MREPIPDELWSAAAGLARVWPFFRPRVQISQLNLAADGDGFWLRLSPLELASSRYWPHEREPRRSSINSSVCPHRSYLKSAQENL